jgi:imidazolonepropionase-like amidohydrolase
MIKRVGKNLSADGATVIDGGGRTLMPGLISMHEHIMMGQDPLSIAAGAADNFEIGALAAGRARLYLDYGFTTIRDMGGNVHGLQAAIETGDIPGPRIYPSGLAISQTGGHGDVRMARDGDKLVDAPRDRGYMEGVLSVTADGVDQVRAAARNNFFRGATQLKVMAGGGVTSLADPLLGTQYTLEEMKAAVAEAERMGTYVTVHSHADGAIVHALDAGVISIDHANLAKEETIKRIVDEGAYLGLQAAIHLRDPKLNTTDSNPIQLAKMTQVNKGAHHVFKWAAQYNAKVLWGTDTFGPRSVFESNMKDEWKYRGEYFSPVEQLQQITGNGGELLAKSGLKQPYSDGPLGVIAEGAYADILVIDGNPMEDINVMADPLNNFKIIMKDGKVYKNEL